MARQYLLVGIPFSGKTTLGRELEVRLGFVHINLDKIKAERGFGNIPDDDVPDHEWESMFKEVNEKVIKALKEGKNVVNETAWITREWRDKARKVARDAGFETKVIFINIPIETARERLLKNRQSKGRYDTPDFEFVDYVKQFEVPKGDEDMIYYDQSVNIDEWINVNKKIFLG